jgi:hypothetical protein
LSLALYIANANDMANYNLIGYTIYGMITYLITVRVGLIFHKNGHHYIKAGMEDESVATSVNNLLLTCYYLTNLGYIAITIWFWEEIESSIILMESISDHIANIVLLLGSLHFVNMLAIYLYSKKKLFIS